MRRSNTPTSLGGYPAASELAAHRAEMFPVLDPDEIARVATFAREQSFGAGTVVWDRGDREVPVYVLLEGELEVVHPSGELEQPVNVHRPGEVSGEIALLFGRPSLVRGRARTALRALRVEPSCFRAIVQTDPELSDLVLRAFLLRRAALLSEGMGDTVVIGSQDSAETLRIGSFLCRSGQPFQYVDIDREPDVQETLDRFHVDAGDVPIVICRNARVLRRPTEAEVADCLGLNPPVDAERVLDVLVCGAGPAGLAAALGAASEGMNVTVVEASEAGGQASESSKIENYLGFPTGLTGEELSGRALVQAEKFGANILVACGAVRLHCDDAPMRVELQGGATLRARAIIVATGARYRKLELPDLARFEGAGIYYAATFVEAQRCGGDEVVVVGGGNSAGQAAVYLARSARHVHLLVRGPGLAENMSRYLVRRLEQIPNVSVHIRTRITEISGAGHLEEILWQDDTTGGKTRQRIRHVFSMAGASPTTEWVRGTVALDESGFVLTGADLAPPLLEREGWPLRRPPMLFETSRPHVFAVGDVRAHNVKRVASAVGEGAVCIELVRRVLAE